MKVFPLVRLMGCFALMAAATCFRADAQVFGLGTTASPNPIGVNGTLTFTISLTNVSSTSFLNVFVTNTLPSSVQVIDAFSTPSTTPPVINPSSVVFSFGNFAVAAIAQMTVLARPTPAAVGSITNFVTVANTTFAGLTTNSVVVQVTNIPPSVTDLAVAVAIPSPIVVHDVVNVRVIVTNLGPASASNVILSNTFSSGGVIPVNPSTNSTTVFALGSLTNLAVRNFVLTIQPTNTGDLPFFASVGSTNVNDSNTNNNTVFTNLTVEALLTNQLIATNLTGMALNFQNALMEQTIRLVNIGTGTVASARVVITGLTNQLWNAAGTNTLGTTNRFPFVVYSSPLDPGESADLLLQYFIPNRLPIVVPDSSYVAIETSAVNLSVPAFSSVTITNIVTLTDGSRLIEFTATVGERYQVQYSSDLNFTTNVFLAQPVIVAQASKVQWIDYGPPATDSHPSTVTMRFYRVRVNP